MQIEYRQTDQLKAYANNTRTHSDEQVAQIVASISEFGFTNPLLIKCDGEIIAGHGRHLAAQKAGLAEVPCIALDHLSDEQARALVIADNKIAENSGWDMDLLQIEMEALSGTAFDLNLLGFSSGDLEQYFKSEEAEPVRLTEADAVPDLQETVVSGTGDVWVLDGHRVMCGDSTSADDVVRLMANQKAELLHSDPPYGMGKQKDGVANDNIYGEELDAFQMAWWVAFRAAVIDNGSVYIWGNAPDLWRLWYLNLYTTEYLELRNQIVWNKKSIAGMASPLVTQYPMATEHCVFIQIGKQFLGNVNSEDFPEEWEPVRSYLAAEADAAGMRPKDLKTICGVGMYSHWFTKSQFSLIPEKHYKALQEHYAGHFSKSWRDIKKDWDGLKGEGSKFKSKRHESIRSFFDNAHDIMRDVWEFPRVVGDERHGHATQKPVAMMERVMKSSCPPGGLCVEPFGGSGSTLMGAENTGRRCYTMELQPKYVDVIVRRWQEYTGGNAVREADGLTFNEVAANV